MFTPGLFPCWVYELLLCIVIGVLYYFDARLCYVRKSDPTFRVPVEVAAPRIGADLDIYMDNPIHNGSP